MPSLAYRTRLLWRRVALCALLPMPTLAVAALAGAPAPLWVPVAWMALMLLHAVRYPRATVDALSLAIAAAAVLPLTGLSVGPLVLAATLAAGLLVHMAATAGLSRV